MTLQVIIHSAEEGGYWAEVPALPGCITQGDTIEELKANIREAIEGWFITEPINVAPNDQIFEIVV
jgi:predicted RNase H-like HicB family nuclease